MLLQIKHLGIQDGARLYSVQTPDGYSGIIRLCMAHVDYNKPPRIEVELCGTAYLREYPYDGEPVQDEPPRIRDLAGAYSALSSFIQTWIHATPEQREDLQAYDEDVAKFRVSYGTGRFGCDQSIPRRIRKRDKWPVRHCEDRPRVLASVAVDKSADGTWYRTWTADLKAALKGTRYAVRIGSVTIKPAILRQLCKLMVDPDLELRDGGGTLEVRTPDKRTRCTIKHGAGDPYAGRNGFEARIVLAAA